MKHFVVKPASSIKGAISCPGDKSIAHRSIIISALAKGVTLIENFPLNEDCLSTVRSFNKLGIKIARDKTTVKVSGKGLLGLRKPKAPIFINESGTTFRLLLGVLAGQPFKVTLLAGRSLSKRPMLRVTAPLRLMGAKIQAIGDWKQETKEEYPPITIQGGKLKGITCKMPVVSAQVKSAVLLAALYAKDKTYIIESLKTRDHTERMLKVFKADIKTAGGKIIISGKNELVSPGKITVPGDISSAAFFIVLGSLLPGSEIIIRNVSLNPFRAGVIAVLRRMNAKIKISRPKIKSSKLEPIGDIFIKSTRLKSAVIKEKEVPSLIDELPILMVAACLAKGKSVFQGVQELRVKETDRVKAMSENLKKMGARISVSKVSGREDIAVYGTEKLKGAKVSSFGDHRTAMSMVVAGLTAQGKTYIDDVSPISKSFPDFLKVLNTVLK